MSRQTCAWPGTWKSWQKFSATRWNSDEVDVTTICFQRERVYCILYYAPRLSSVCTVARSVPHNTECSAIFVAHRRPNTLFIVYMKCLLLFANHVLCIWLQFLKHHTLKMKKKKRVKNKQQCIKKKWVVFTGLETETPATNYKILSVAHGKHCVKFNWTSIVSLVLLSRIYEEKKLRFRSAPFFHIDGLCSGSRYLYYIYILVEKSWVVPYTCTMCVCVCDVFRLAISTIPQQTPILSLSVSLARICRHCRGSWSGKSIKLSFRN